MNSIKPHGAWFLLAPAFLIAGGVVATALVTAAVGRMDTGRQPLPVPGEGVIEIAEGGEQAIYFEETGTSRARVPAGMTLSIIPEGGTMNIVPSEAKFSSTYHMGGRAGILYGDVELSAGRYRVKTTLPDGIPAPSGATLLIGKSPVAGMVGAVLGAVGAAGAGFLLAVISLVVVAVRRARSRKMQMMAQYPPMQYPPAGPPGGWPAPPPGVPR